MQELNTLRRGVSSLDRRKKTQSQAINARRDLIVSNGWDQRTGSAPVLSSSNQILWGLPSEYKKLLIPELRAVRLGKEQYIYQQGEDIDHVYFPETAVVSEFMILEDGRMVEVAMTGREGSIGLNVLCSATTSASCVQVSQAGVASRIEISAFRRLMRVYPEVAQYFLPHLETYIRFLSQRAICNMYHSVEERLCTWLLMLQDRSQRTMLKLTHEQIARTLGVYRPSVTCIALDLRKQDVIDYSRGGITIEDRVGLQRLACDCYTELAPVAPASELELIH